MFNGKKLGDYLRENGITHVAIARTLGVSEGAVRHIIVGIKQPSLAMAAELARMMGCTLNELIIQDENNGDQSNGSEQSDMYIPMNEETVRGSNDCYERIIELCRKKGVSCSRAALDIGLGNSTATMWKNGAVPRSTTLHKIAEYFDVSVDYLLGMEPLSDEKRVNVLGTTAFARNLKALRIERGMTQKQLANSLKVAESTISLYEGGKREPEYKILLEIANIFNVSADYLLKNNCDDELTEAIGVIVRELRGEMSLREFASKCGCAHTTIDNIEKGVDFRTGKPVETTVATLAKIAQACDVPVSWIIWEAESESKGGKK